MSGHHTSPERERDGITPFTYVRGFLLRWASTCLHSELVFTFGACYNYRVLLFAPCYNLRVHGPRNARPCFSSAIPQPDSTGLLARRPSREVWLYWSATTPTPLHTPQPVSTGFDPRRAFRQLHRRNVRATPRPIPRHAQPQTRRCGSKNCDCSTLFTREYAHRQRAKS